MIPIERLDLDDPLPERLAAKTLQLIKDGGGARKARDLWGSSRVERDSIRQKLALMAAGIQRCMYCGDNLGTDIDHFDPISRTPLKTFEWLNHLLACSHCNSNKKRDRYPCDAAGECLLIDPTRENPSEHLQLMLGSGEFVGQTRKGWETIEVFGLNRPDLILGRGNAFRTRRMFLFGIHKLVSEGREDEAVQHMKALVEEPHASVLHAMLRTRGMTDAEDILGSDVVAVLGDPGMQRLVQDIWQIESHAEGITPVITASTGGTDITS